MHKIIYSFVTVLLMGCMCLSSCKSKEDKEHILYENFVKVNREVEDMCRQITQFVKK